LSLPFLLPCEHVAFFLSRGCKHILISERGQSEIKMLYVILEIPVPRLEECVGRSPKEHLQGMHPPPSFAFMDSAHHWKFKNYTREKQIMWEISFHSFLPSSLPFFHLSLSLPFFNHALIIGLNQLREESLD
jgi:hypothetical protein